MGLIRSKNTHLTVYDDDKLTNYLWPIIREIMKTAIENNQNLIVEGVYIPFNWEKDFDDIYLKKIKYVCLIMSKNYIENNFDIILKNENTIEKREKSSKELKDIMIKDNIKNLRECEKYNLSYILIDRDYEKEIEIKIDELLDM